MIPTQPVISFKYFSIRKNSTPKGIKELFYLSWEDALWDILIHKKVKKGSIILLPDFYCSDVEKNIKNHGYKIARYRIRPDLTADRKSFFTSIVKYKPSVVIIFNPVGIKNNLFDNLSWLSKVTHKAILIEDSVHRVLDLQAIKIIKKNHFVVDSLRKVIPIQGSRVFGRTCDLDFNVPSVFNSLSYFIKVNINCLLMNIFWTLGFCKKAEKLMLAGYDLIGDSIFPVRGSIIARFFSDRINVDKIQNLKKKQVNYYEQKLIETLSVKLKLKENDKKNLRGYPLILPVSAGNKILKYLREQGLLVRFELEDSLWSKKHKIIYLPLGFDLSRKSQDKICFLVNKAIQKV